ncbi:hypothetical protein [Parasitella parasitica]|uniref:Uncharacterized protein n=1 Tax=Parasitella parasitica TaxID=35722 RepID=A0A0B7NG75_9FUNG|nr:hypothetical protein [Parasitella parasitica]
MDNLFWALVKENSKRDIIQHWSDKLFSAEAYTDDSVISGAVVNTGYNTDIDPKAKLDSNLDAGTDTCSEDEQDSQDKAEDQDEDEDENDKQEADLTSREIKALVSVCIILCESGEIEGDIGYAYLKKQLYSDKQESIPTESLEVYARLSQYDLQFLGSRASKKKGQGNSCIKTNLGQATKDDEDSAKSLTAALKALKADLRVWRKEIKNLEKRRQNAGRKSRRFEKVNKDLDAALYQKLKDIQKLCNHQYVEVLKLQEQIRNGQSRLFLLIEKIHNQPVIYPQLGQKNALSIHAATAIQGIDPGLVTMASGVYTSPSTPINSIKRYQGAPQSAEDDRINTFKLTARFIDKACLKQSNIHSNHKRVQRRRVIGRIRLKKSYQKHCSRNKTKLNGRSVVTFVGNWSGVSTFVKGHMYKTFNRALLQTIVSS